MREIKFRAWDISGSRKMSPTFGVDCRELWQWCEAKGLECELDGELMQYTGLLDKNGKEIYEGDLVKVGKEIWKVILGDGGAYGLEKLDGISAPSFYNYYLEGGKYDVEIIGNIYENPELLEN